MKNKSSTYIVLATMFSITLNIVCKYIAEVCHFPIWFDSLGTLFMAYVGGPINGAMVGFASDIVYGVFIDNQSAYSLVGIVIGVVVGFFAKKRYFDTAFSTMNLGVLLAIICTGLSSLINLIFYKGLIGNMWGDQMFYMLQSHGVPTFVSILVGQFYVEFLDKIVAVILLYLGIKLHRNMRDKKSRAPYLHSHMFFSKEDKNPKKENHILSAVVAFILISEAVLLCLSDSVMVSAKEKDEIGLSTYTQMTYSKEEGLSAGEANCIAQTKDGMLWIGTYAGLYTYDGKSFTLHTEFDSIKNVNCMYVDEEGRIWVGTNDLGLSIIINGVVINVFDKTNGMPSNSVRSINRDSDGFYYVGTSLGMAVITIDGGMTLTDTVDEVSYAKSIATDENDHITVVTEEGVLFLLKDKQILEKITPHKSGEIFNCCYMEDETLYVGTNTNTITKYELIDDQLVERQSVTCNDVYDINSINRIESGELFVCSDAGVGYFTQSGSFEVFNTNSFNSSVGMVLEDYQGNLWFTSSRLGLLELCETPFEDVFSEVGFDSDVVNAILSWNGNMYYGCDHGLRVTNANSTCKIENSLTEYFADARIRCLMIDRDNQLWIATTGNGLYCVPDKMESTDEIVVYNETNCELGNRFRSMIQTSDGSIVACGDDGVVCIQNGEIAYTLQSQDGLTNTKILTLYENEDGTIMAGSDGGGIFLIKDGVVTGTLSTENGLRSDVILKIRPSSVQKGFFVITSNSICYVDQDLKCQNTSNFPYSNNYDIISDGEGAAWVVGSAGIYIVNEEALIENEKIDAELINTKSGLRMSMIANSWPYWDEHKNLYLCGDSGACYVNMDKVDKIEKAYRMILNHVRLDGEDVEINRTDVLEIGTDVMRIDFEPYILNYSLSDPYISYYLEGYDENETVIPLNQLETISYTNLPSGKYVFHLSVLNARQNTVIESDSYSFYKKSEMYQNWWFKTYVAFVAALFIIWFTWFFTRSRIQKTIEHQKLQLEYARKQIEMGNETILSIARTVDAKDSNTSQHSFRVSEYSFKIATRLGWDEKRCENLRQMALLHDIGKIGIPDSILNKPARLTDEEYEIMKTHVTRGGEILKDFTLIENVAVGAMYHHERYDGKGYAFGLKGENIPIEARIIGLADAFDAMTANRVYRKQLDLEVVLDELHRCSGTQFDPNLVDVFLTLIDEGDVNVQELYEQSKEEES